MPQHTRRDALGRWCLASSGAVKRHQSLVRGRTVLVVVPGQAIWPPNQTEAEKRRRHLAAVKRYRLKNRLKGCCVWCGRKRRHHQWRCDRCQKKEVIGINRRKLRQSSTHRT